MSLDYKLKDTNYIQIQGWMISRLDLKGNELLVYALIHGFCQDGKNVYNMSFDYIMKWLNSSRSATASSISNLLEKGLIERRESYSRGNVKKYEYWTKVSREGFPAEKEDSDVSDQFEFRTGEKSTSKNSELVTSTNSEPVTSTNSEPVTSTNSELVTSTNSELNNSLNNTLNINSSSSSETEFKSDTEKNTAGQKEEEPFLNFIKKKFGSAHVFTKDFEKKLENHMQNNQIPHAETADYLNFVYELCKKKNPANMSAYFFTTSLNDVTAANYIHQKINGAPEKKKDFRCPVCGCMHSAFEDCPKCGLDKDGRNNAELIGILQKEQKLLPEQRRKLDEEMVALTMEFMSLPPNRWAEKKQRKKQIYAKYGLLDLNSELNAGG